VVDVPVAADRVATQPLELDGAQTLGVTWPEDGAGAALDVQVRTRTDGVWADWVTLDDEASPDVGTTDAEQATRAGTEPLWLGDSDAVQISVTKDAGVAADDLSLALIGDNPGITGAPDAAEPPAPSAGTDGSDVPEDRAAGPDEPVAPAPATPAPSPTATGAASRSDGAVFRTLAGAVTTSRSATTSVTPAVATSTATAVPAAAGAPRIISRAEWGAPAQTCTPDVATGLVGAVVHHTAGSNSYSSVSEAMNLLRNDAAYHISARGWCDLGYNFVVDKWGNIYEGRAGSAALPVIGVHAGGFNTGTVGVAMLGTYDAMPSAATQSAVGTIIGWRLGSYRVDPLGTMRYATGAGENSRYLNETVTLPRIFGHRDVAFTACPGNGGYAALPTIRYAAASAAQASWAQPPSSLMRSPNNATVYLLSGGQRHAISDLATMSSLAPLGSVTYVPDQYLASWPVGTPVTRALRSPDGTVFFVDSGIVLTFGACDQVRDYGLDCATSTPIDAAQLAQMHRGGRMTNLYRTTSGKAFYVTGGVKREVADDTALQQAGLPADAVWLLESGIAHLPYGDPVVRDGLRLDQRDGARSILLRAEGDVLLPSSLAGVPGLWSGPAAALDMASMARVDTDSTLTPFMTDGGRTYLLTERGKVAVGTGTASSRTPAAPAGLLAAVPSAGTAASPLVIKGDDQSTVSVVLDGRRHGFRSWADLTGYTGSQNPGILVVAGAIARSIDDGGLFNPPGILAKTADNATVYLIDGAGAKVPVSSMSVPAELGATRLAVLPAADLTARSTAQGNLRTLVQCGSSAYIGLNGQLWPISPSDRSAFPASATELDPVTCAALPKAARSADTFWRVANGTIFQLSNGVRRPIGSYARYVELGGTSTNTTLVSDFAAAQVPIGAVM
jgi:hypothetical protein